MASKVEICNMALGWLGVPPITSLQEARPEARYADQYYTNALEKCLRDYRWSFAQRRVRLAEVDVPDGYQASYENAYSVPAECLLAHTVMDESGRGFDFEVALAPDGGSRVILTNAPRAYLSFTALVTVTELFDPNFTRALARRIAADLVAPVLKNNPQKVQECETLYARALQEAWLADSREGKEEEPESDWIKARTGAMKW